jgi:hypothetical protein
MQRNSHLVKAPLPQFIASKAIDGFREISIDLWRLWEILRDFWRFKETYRDFNTQPANDPSPKPKNNPKRKG